MAPSIHDPSALDLGSLPCENEGQGFHNLGASEFHIFHAR